MPKVGRGDPLVRADGRTKPDRNWYPENFDWYLKWAATIAILISIIFRSAGADFRFLDLSIGTVGVLLWLWVAVIWKDRALIILNAVSLMLLSSTLLREVAL